MSYLEELEELLAQVEEVPKIKIKRKPGFYGTYFWHAESKGMVSSKEKWNNPANALLEFMQTNEKKLRLNVEIDHR